MTILVTGATGNVGRALVRRLLTDGEQVRATTTRDPGRAALPAGLDIRQADLTDPDSVAPALDGIERLFLFPVVASAAGSFMEVAKAAGIRRVVVLSSEAVSHPRAANGFSVEHHRTVEEAVAAADVDWTFLRPSGFAANTLDWAADIRSGNPVRAPYPHAAQALLHEDDIAAVAAEALSDGRHSGQVYLMTGPAAVDKVAQVEAIGAAVGRTIRFEEVTPEQWRAPLVQHGVGLLADMMIELWAEATVAPEPVQPTVELVLGRQPRTFAEWAHDHRADFGMEIAPVRA